MDITTHEEVHMALAVHPPEQWTPEQCAAVLNILNPDHDDEARVLAELIYHAVCLAPNDNSGLTKHVVWDIQQLMAALDPYVDMEPSELMCVALLMARANERRLGRGGNGFPGRPVPTPTPLLRVVNS